MSNCMQPLTSSIASTTWIRKRQPTWKVCIYGKPGWARFWRSKQPYPCSVLEKGIQNILLHILIIECQGHSFLGHCRLMFFKDKFLKVHGKPFLVFGEISNWYFGFVSLAGCISLAVGPIEEQLSKQHQPVSWKDIFSFPFYLFRKALPMYEY